MFWDSNSHAWATDGVELEALDNRNARCASNHLTDFTILLAIPGDTGNNSQEKYVIPIMSAAFVFVAILFILLSIVILSKYPSLRRLILEGQTPSQTKKNRVKMQARISSHTMQQYGLQNPK